MEEKNQPIEKPNLDDLEMHMPEGTMSVPETVPGKRVTNGPILLILIFLLVLILGGMFWWYYSLTNPGVEPLDVLRPTAEENNEPESTTAEAEVETMQAISTSDELGAIEADLFGTDIEVLDDDFAAIESVLNNPNQ
jgi:hypothetical protein